MANTSVNYSSQRPTVPIFKGEKYHIWSIKSQNLFRSQELWDIVEGRYDKPQEPPEALDKKLRENRKLDAKALFLIQSALDDDIFPRISAVLSSKQA